MLTTSGVHLPPSSTIVNDVNVADMDEDDDEDVRGLMDDDDSAERLEALDEEWRAKYDRLWEAHRKLQKTNHALEDKLLRVVDKFETDKNAMTRDLASQTQRLVQTKLSISQLRERNGELQSDLRLAVTLLQNRPSSFLAQRVDSLPADMQQRVRAYLAEQQQQQHSGGSKIRVPIMDDVDVNAVGEDERVSAAILAKVLEERAKERRKEHKFCIDVGTQTHGWHFPDKEQQKSRVGSNASTADVVQILKSISMDGENESSPSRGNIFVASVIKSPPASVNNDQRRRPTGIIRRSATFSATETDL